MTSSGFIQCQFSPERLSGNWSKGLSLRASFCTRGVPLAALVGSRTAAHAAHVAHALADFTPTSSDEKVPVPRPGR